MSPGRRRAKQIAIFVAASALYFAYVFYVSSRNLLWYDEVFTVRIAALPDLATILDALRHPVDIQPPLYFLITRASMALFGENHCGARLPSMIGVWAMAICVYLFLRRRCTGFAAASAVVLVMMFWTLSYAWEARPYGIIFGCAGVALLSWQYAIDSRHRRLALVVFAATLALAPCVNYYAILIFVPFGIAELVRAIRTKRPDWPIWSVLVLATIPFLAHLSYILPATSGSAAVRLWNAPTVGSLVALYPTLLANAHPGFFVLFLFFVLIRNRKPELPLLPPHERAALWGFAAVPLFGFALAYFVTHVFHPRYVIFSVIGIGCLFALAIRRTLPAHPKRDLVVLGVSAWFCGMTAVQFLYTADAVRPDPGVLTLRLPKQVEDSGLPVVVGSGLRYWPMDYYAPDAVRERICYVADTEVAARRTGNVSVDGGLLVTRKYFHPRVFEWQQFRKQNRAFFILWPRQDTAHYQWLLDEVKAMGATVEDAGSWAGEGLYSVTLPPQA